MIHLCAYALLARFSGEGEKNSSCLLRNGSSVLQVSSGNEFFLICPLILDSMRSSCFEKNPRVVLPFTPVAPSVGLVTGEGWGTYDSDANASSSSWTTCYKEDSSTKEEITPGSQTAYGDVCVCVCVRSWVWSGASLHGKWLSSHPIEQTSGINLGPQNEKVTSFDMDGLWRLLGYWVTLMCSCSKRQKKD